LDLGRIFGKERIRVWGTVLENNVPGVEKTSPDGNNIVRARD